MREIKNVRRLVCIVLCICMVLPLSACGESKMTQRQVFAMDTVMTLTAYGNKADIGLNAAQSVIMSMDSMLDPELETSTTYAINNAMGASIVVSGQVADMINTAKTVYERSGGALDLSLYPVIKRWGFIDGHYYVPTELEIAEDLARKCFGDIVLSSFPSSGSYALTIPVYGQLTFGAIAKGCAANNAIAAMRNAGVTSGIISLGGNVQTLGKKPDGSNWTVAVQDPNNTSTYLGILEVGETAVVTSGTYQRFFTQNNKTYHHIINPKTGSPVSNTLKSVTVICPDGTLADGLSTAMFVLGESAALNYWRKYGEFEMILINNDNEVICTKGLIEKFELTNDSYTLKFVE